MDLVSYGAACTSPLPICVAAIVQVRAVANRRFLIAWLLSAPDVSAHSAPQLTTCEHAMLVPLMVLYLTGLGHVEKMSRPVPAISILPRHENDDGTSVRSSEATDMIVGEFAGAIVGAPLLFPAAAMIRHTLFKIGRAHV